MLIRITLRGIATALLPLLACGCALAQQQLPSVLSSPAQSQHRSAATAFAHLPLGFQPNRGQSDPAVQFVARTPQSTVYLTGSDAVLETAGFSKDAHGRTQLSSEAAIRMHLAGAAANPAASTGDTLAGTVNYLSGNDRSQWHTGLPQYSSVRLASVYPGVDLKYYGRGSTLEYDFVVAPDADPSQIVLQFQGASAHRAEDGDLVLPTGDNHNLRFDRPVAYQQIDGKRVSVGAEFRIASNHDVSFQLGPYDHARELVIDPTLVFVGTLGAGASGTTNLSQIAVDASGELLMIGTTNDSSFPVSASAYQKVCGPGDPNYGAYCNNSGKTAAFISKISADGTTLVYSTYLSGTESQEYGDAIAVDSTGVAYLFGRTGSDTFPVTPDAFQSKCIAGVPYFPGGVQSQCDGYYAIGGGASYQSLNTPAFFAKLSADGSKLLYSSFLGGTQPVYPNTIALDASGNIYLSGQVHVFSTADLTPGQLPTSNAQFPAITPSGYLTVANATNGNGTTGQGINTAAFLSKFANDGHTLLYGTFFGDNTSAADTDPTTMTVGANGVAFLGGFTYATHFPVTTGAIKSACTSPGTNYNGIYCNVVDGYVAAIDTTKSGAASLTYSTRVGGKATAQGSNIPDQKVLGLAADSSNNLFVTGYTFESSFSVGTGGFQTSCPNNTGNVAPTANGYVDRCDSAFVLKLNPTGTAILAGSFLAGPSLRSSESIGYNVKLDSKGQVYLYGASNAGCCDNDGVDFPVVNPIQAHHSGSNLFVSTFTPDLSKLLFSTRFTNPAYQDHSVAVAGGMVLDTNGNIYFGGITADATFGTTNGTYSTSGGGGYNHAFFAKLSKVLQPTSITASATPSPANQGTNVTYKAVVAGLYQSTPAPTGSITFQVTNSTATTTIGTGTLDNTGTATFTGTAPAPGTYTLTAKYGGDSTYDVSTSTGVTLTVNSTAATSVAVLSSAPTSASGIAVTFTAAVTSTSSGTPTGQVTFFDGSPSSGGTQLGTGMLSGGSATFATGALAVGTHSIYAVYAGDTNFAGSTSAPLAQVVTAASIAVTLNPTTLTVTHGSSGTVTITATPTGAYSGTLTFSCGTLPSNASCSFLPSTLTFSNSTAAQTSILTLSTQTTNALLRQDPFGLRLSQIVAALLLPMGLLGFAGRRRHLGLLLLLVSLTGLAVGITGCGGSGSSSTTPASPTTPVGSYTVSIMVSANGASSTTPLTVIVQ